MKRWEKGFTLLEMLIVLAITGVIVGPLTMATISLLTNPQRSADLNVVLSQVQSAGHWISRDVQMSRTVTPGGSTGLEPLTLTIPVSDDANDDLTVKYLFDGNKLKREVRDASTLISETLIANFVDTADTSFVDLGSGLYKLTIKASRSETAITRGYEVGQRVSPF